MKRLAAGLTALALLAVPVGPLSAAPLSVPYVVKAGDTFGYTVRYLRATLMDGQPNPIISIDYDLELTITKADDKGSLAAIRSSRTNISIDQQRVLAPPDFDSLIFLAVDGLTAEIEVAADGALIEVANWDTLRPAMAEKARTIAADEPAMLKALDALLPTVGPVDAVQFFARPLAMSAPGRVVTFDPPGRMSVTAENIELPSFATYAAGRWSFDLIQRADIPDSTTVEWIGIPGAEELKAILGPIGEQLEATSPLTDEMRAEMAEDSKMWQRFAATYGEEDGRLLEFQGLMELHAGPLKRRVAIETRSKGR